MLKVRCNYKHKYLIICSSDYKGSTVDKKDAMVPIGDSEAGGRNTEVWRTLTNSIAVMHTVTSNHTHRCIKASAHTLSHRATLSVSRLHCLSLLGRASPDSLFSFHSLAYSQIMYNLEAGMASLCGRFCGRQEHRTHFYCKINSDTVKTSLTEL